MVLMSGQRLGPTEHRSVPSRARPRRRLLGGALRSAFVVSLVTVSVITSASPPAGALSKAPAQGAGLVWVCRPGQAANPYAASLAVTSLTAAGTQKPATWPRSAVAAKFDCFYVHPTDSLAKAANTGLAVTPALVGLGRSLGRHAVDHGQAPSNHQEPAGPVHVGTTAGRTTRLAGRP